MTTRKQFNMRVLNGKLFKEEKGQGALEYLLLIGGAILVAAIVMSLLVSISGDSKDSIQTVWEKYLESLNTLIEAND